MVEVDAARFLRSVYFFRELRDEPLQALAAACGRSSAETGDIVFAEGEPGDRFFIVVDGLVELWKDFGYPGRRILGEQGPGQLFGEMSLVDNLNRSATARAIKPTEMLHLRRSDFQAIVEEYPAVAMTVMQSLSYIIRHSNESFVFDLNQRNRELEEAYRKLESAQRSLVANERFSNLGKFSNMILHDLRNPVSVLKGYAQVLHSVADRPVDVRDYSMRILVEAERLGHLAGELLDYTRGEIRLDMTVITPAELRDAVLVYVREKFELRNVRLNVDIVDDQGFMCDRDRLVRVLVNILDNARKACQRSGHVNLSFARDGGFVEIRVEDDGEGMDEATLHRVFEPFFSRSSSGGTGLGMVIVKHVVEAHGGELILTSSEGEGTAVSMRLPARAG